MTTATICKTTVEPEAFKVVFSCLIFPITTWPALKKSPEAEPVFAGCRGREWNINGLLEEKMDFSIQGVTDPRIEQIAADVAVRMEKILARIGIANETRAGWMQESPESPLVEARALAEGFAEPPADLLGAALLLRPSIMEGALDPQWVREKYGADIHDRLQPLVKFFSVCESMEDMAVRLRAAPVEARLMELTLCLTALRSSLQTLHEDPAAETDYGLRRSDMEKVIDACRGVNPILEAQVDNCLVEIRRYYPAQSCGGPDPGPIDKQGRHFTP
jgi:hypothetical protein